MSVYLLKHFQRSSVCNSASESPPQVSPQIYDPRVLFPPPRRVGASADPFPCVSRQLIFDQALVPSDPPFLSIARRAEPLFLESAPFTSFLTFHSSRYLRAVHHPFRSTLHPSQLATSGVEFSPPFFEHIQSRPIKHSAVYSSLCTPFSCLSKVLKYFSLGFYNPSMVNPDSASLEVDTCAE